MRVSLRRGIPPAAFLLGVLLITQAHSQVKPLPAPNPPGATDPNEPQPEGYQSFTFPYDRDSSQLLDAVIAYQQKQAIPWDIVCSTAQRLLDAPSDSLYAEKDPETGKLTGVKISVKAKVRTLIGEFPKEGRQFYELTYGPTADALLKEASTDGYDKPKIALVSQRFFHTQAGGQATLLLASIDVASGNYSEAAYAFHRLLSRPDTEEFLTPRVLLKAIVALKRSGDVRQSEESTQLMTRLERNFPRNGLVIGRRTYTLEELKTELEKPLGQGLSQVAEQFVSMTYGNASRTGVGFGGMPFLAPTFTFPMLYRQDDNYKQGADWVKENLKSALAMLDRAKGQVAVPSFFPVTAPNLILFRGFDGVYAVSTKEGLVLNGETYHAGEMVWISEVTGGLQTLFNDNATQKDVLPWWQSFWHSQMPAILFENGIVGTLCHDGKYVYFIDDLAIPPQPPRFNQNMGIGGPNRNGAAVQVNGMTDFNRLVALDIETGKLVWDLGRLAAPNLDAAPVVPGTPITNTLQLTENSFFLGAPLPINGKLYVLFEKESQIKLACLDPNHMIADPTDPNAGTYPELVWIQNLGSPNTKLSEDSLRRIQPAMLSYSDGVIVCPTNCGAIVAVDINARSLLWAKYYAESNEVPQVGGRRPIGRPVPPGFGFDPNTGQMSIPRDRWRTAAPIISSGKVILTASDMDRIICYDLRTGAELWSDDRKKDDLYVAGVIDNRVLVVGKESVRAYNLDGAPNQKPSLAWQGLAIGTPTGHGVGSKDGFYYLPVLGSTGAGEAKEPQIWEIDVKAGTAVPKATFRQKDPTQAQTDPRLALGNLLFHEGQLFSQSAANVTAFPLIELKMKEMDRLLALNPNDPKGLTDRGELRLDKGRLLDAIADFKKAQMHEPTPVTARNIREKLYIAYTELLQDDFNKGESFLNEYEQLSEVSVDSDDPSVRQRQIEENVRRRGLFLSLVAKGRESQGRLLEAFENYRAFAVLNGNKQLVSIHDEPGGLTRPDVWARGRIDAMIRNTKDAAARKPLEDRVNQEWLEIKGANDLPALRDFVKVFGPYFKQGQDAQFLLAEKLLQTNNDEDFRSAQTLLMQLWATAESPALEAKAVESLARVLKRRGMLEDAVGLYAQLGERYSDVVVRDGKTGADIVADLLTDRTLLPYLEPALGPQSSGYKLNIRKQPANRQFQQSFSITPEGRFLPTFQRLEFTMQMSRSGDNSWELLVTDRHSGEEHCRFPGLGPIQPLNGSYMGPPSYRMAQASGHLLLVTIGHYAYCFDLAEKRKLWDYNLLGSTAAPNVRQLRMEQATPDGDVVIYYEDGWSVRLGRASVLEPGYVCLSTREGLVTLDPISGEKLWVRSNLPAKIQVFGDSRYIFVAEGNSSRVIRAVDGSTVKGIKDFSSEMNSKDRLAVLGRSILLAENNHDGPSLARLYDPLAGKDIWKKEFPKGSVRFKSRDPEMVGFLTPEGRFEILASRTGEIVTKGQLDADKISPTHRDANGKVVSQIHDENGKFEIQNPYLLADHERVYLFLNRPYKQNRGTFGAYTFIRHENVNGAVYGFDKATGKRLWYNDNLFEQQSLLLDRFDDLPVIVAAAQQRDPKTNVNRYQLLVFDKKNGRVKHHDSHPQNGTFISVFTDAKDGSIEFFRYDLQLRIERLSEQAALR